MKRCVYVAEIGINHNGDIALALQLIDLAKKHGFDYVKFQKRDIDQCYTQEYLASARKSPWGTTQRDQKQGLELSIFDYETIDAYCRKIGIKWFYSPWDIESAQVMARFDCDYVKIAKACLTNPAIAVYYNKTAKPLVVSTNPFCEDEDAYIAHFNNVEYLLSCVSLYPAPSDFTGLEGILSLGQHYLNKIGYSNHSPYWVHPVIASYLGAKMIEVHITLDKDMYGSDQKASLDDADLANMMHFCKKPKADISEYLKQEQGVLGKLRQTW